MTTLEYYVTNFDSDLRNEIAERVKVMQKIYKQNVMVHCYCGEEKTIKSIVRYYRTKGFTTSKNAFKASIIFTI